MQADKEIAFIITSRQTVQIMYKRRRNDQQILKYIICVYVMQYSLVESCRTWEVKLSL
jgi:hypothetical protein